MNDRKRLADAIKAYHSEARQEYKSALNDAIAEAKLSLKPGQPAPDYSYIPEGFYRESAQKAIGRKRAAALALIDGKVQTLSKSLTEAPEAETLNYLLSLIGRSNMTETEYSAAMERYGRNHAAAKAINQAAAASGIAVASMPSEVEKDLKDALDLRGKAEAMMSYTAIETATDGSAAVDAAMLDGYGEGRSVYADISEGFGSVPFDDAGDGE